jgi:hypothetical protein
MSVFDFAGGEGAIASLLAEAPEAAASEGLQTQDLPAVQEALAEVEDAATVDAIIDHFAGAGEGAFHGGGLAVDVLDQALPGGVFLANAPDPVEDASQLAAAAQA